MESSNRDGEMSATKVLISMFPPPDGVEFTFFCDEPSLTNICLCDVAGKSFVGKGATREEAQANGVTCAFEGLGLALVQTPQGNEVRNMQPVHFRGTNVQVVNIADEKRRLAFMVKDLKADITNAETRREAELKLYKDTIQSLKEEATIMKSDLIKMRDEKEILNLENEKMKSYLTSKQPMEGGGSEFWLKRMDDKCGSQAKLYPLQNRQKIQFLLSSKKSLGELKFENERLNDKVTALERQKNALQVDMKKMEEKYCDKFGNNNLSDKVYKLQKAEIKKLKLKNKNLFHLKTENKLNIFNLEVKSKAYNIVMEAHNTIMKEETQKLRANYDKLEMQHKMCTLKDNCIVSEKSDKEILKNDVNFKKAELSKLVTELIGQVKDLEQNNSNVIRSMKSLSDQHETNLLSFISFISVLLCYDFLNLRAFR